MIIRFKNMKLKNKLLISYLLLIILPLLIFKELTFKEISQILENRIIYSANQAFKWYSQLPGSGSRVFMIPPSFYNESNRDDAMVLSAARRITRSTNYIDIIGYLKIDFLEQTIRSILANANAVNGSLTYIRNRDDRIVSKTDETLLKNYRVSLADIEVLQDAKEWVILNLNDEACYVRATTIKDTDWTIITVIPRDDIFREVKSLSHLMLVFLIIIIPIAISFSILLTVQITRRLNKLSSKMKNVTENIYEAHNEEADRTDEIGELSSSYNYMVKRISTLAEEQYKTGLSIKSAELELLQAQINPHFLYNTMDMINWMSYDNRGEEIRNITRALSTFYKISLSKGASKIPLKNELKHVSLYIEIQNYRLQNVIQFSVDCPEHLKGYLIPKITLQPIVENAVVHGILQTPNRTGTINITCRDYRNTMIISIKDDGMGMEQQEIDNLENRKEDKEGFGLINIHTRLMLTYNEKSGLSIESEKGIGTVVKITIPKIK